MPGPVSLPCSLVLKEAANKQHQQLALQCWAEASAPVAAAKVCTVLLHAPPYLPAVGSQLFGLVEITLKFQCQSFLCSRLHCCGVGLFVAVE